MKLGQPGEELFQLLTGAQSGLSMEAIGDREETPETASDGFGLSLDADCAGVYLLLRAILDARLIGLSGGAGWPNLEASSEDGGEALSRKQALLLALGLRWAGAGGSE